MLRERPLGIGGGGGKGGGKLLLAAATLRVGAR
jgi:hypothetical protein